MHVGFILFLSYKNKKKEEVKLLEKYMKIVFGYFCNAKKDQYILKIMVYYMQYMYILINIIP